jgi:V/A-type H+-transporting ATPase subunit C
MLTHSIDFVENSEYAFAVAKIRALETGYIDEVALNTLLTAEGERFTANFFEVTGVRMTESDNVSLILDNLERSFSDSFLMVKALLIEEYMRRLISLRYDYELLKLIVKEVKGKVVRIHLSLLERSNYSHEMLKTSLGEGKALDTGETMYRTYRKLLDLREAGGREIDTGCDRAYYSEVFQILDVNDNQFIRNYFVREIDALNIVTTLRLKIQGKKRSMVKERYIPFGTIALSYLEEGFDLNLDGFATRIQFSPLANLLREVNKGLDEEAQVAQVEKYIEDDQTRYLRESMFVTFGIEPLLSYLWTKERELKNLRTIFITKMSGVGTDEIKKYVRGIYG